MDIQWDLYEGLIHKLSASSWRLKTLGYEREDVESEARMKAWRATMAYRMREDAGAQDAEARFVCRAMINHVRDLYRRADRRLDFCELPRDDANGTDFDVGQLVDRARELEHATMILQAGLGQEDFNLLWAYHGQDVEGPDLPGAAVTVRIVVTEDGWLAGGAVYTSLTAALVSQVRTTVPGHEFFGLSGGCQATDSVTLPPEPHTFSGQASGYGLPVGTVLERTVSQINKIHKRLSAARARARRLVKMDPQGHVVADVFSTSRL